MYAFSNVGFSIFLFYPYHRYLGFILTYLSTTSFTIIPIEVMNFLASFSLAVSSVSTISHIIVAVLFSSIVFTCPNHLSCTVSIFSAIPRTCKYSLMFVLLILSFFVAASIFLKMFIMHRLLHIFFCSLCLFEKCLVKCHVALLKWFSNSLSKSPFFIYYGFWVFQFCFLFYFLFSISFVLFLVFQTFFSS